MMDEAKEILYSQKDASIEDQNMPSSALNMQDIVSSVNDNSEIARRRRDIYEAKWDKLSERIDEIKKKFDEFGPKNQNITIKEIESLEDEEAQIEIALKNIDALLSATNEYKNN